jgi:hypothetical protein
MMGTWHEDVCTFMTTLVTNLVIFTFVTAVTNVSVVTLATTVTFDTRL